MSFDPSHDLVAGDIRFVDERRRRVSTAYTPLVILITALGAVGVVLYAHFLLAPDTRGDWLPWLLVVTAESILVLHALLAMWTTLAGVTDPRDYRFHAAQDALLDPATSGRFPDDPTRWPLRLDGRAVEVDVFVTVYGEPIETVRRTVEAARDLTGRHLTWVLDDGRSDEVRDLAARLGVRYLRRLSSNGAKAGNVNHAMAVARGEFFVIFDADFVAKPQFLVETLPFFVHEDLAFVQTPQAYGNLHSVISRGAGYMQTVFYRFIQPGRNHFNAAFCVGTNVIFRRAAVDDIGGMYTDSKSEDVWTSLLLHERGWRSTYISDVLAVGDAPETIEGYTKQQQRWATGGFEILLRHNPFSPKRRLSAEQRIMYFVTSTHYLTGITPALLLLVPPLEIYFDLRPVTMETGLWTWLIYYLGFYGMQIVLAFFTLGSFRWECLLLATVSFPIYVRALVNVLIGREQKWHVTGGRHRVASPFNFMVPQVLFLTFLVPTSAVAVWRDLDHHQITLATGWNITNTLILTSFVVTGMREHRRLRRPAVDAAPPADDATPPTPTRTVVVAPVDRPAVTAPPRLEPPVRAGRRRTPVHARLVHGGTS